jgi:phage repressor protein C with HTH and peptisase S24 domain
MLVRTCPTAARTAALPEWAIASPFQEVLTMAKHQNARDQQTGSSGKVANDTNKLGETRPTQKNEGRRTPESRHERDSQVGSHNQNQARRGAPNSGATPKSGCRG